MRRSLIVTVVGLGALILGVIVAGRPTDVPSDVISSGLPKVTSTTSTTVRATTTIGTSPSTTTIDAATSTTPVTTSTTTTVPAPSPSTTLLPESSVRVVVANATNVSGVAARTVERLRAFGYTYLVATDALVDRAESTIIYVDGRSAEALRLAAQLGLDASIVQPRQTGELTVNQEDGEIWVLMAADQA